MLGIIESQDRSIPPESLLDRIRKELAAKADTAIAGEVVNSGENLGGWVETVSIIVAPTPPIYDIEKLNRYMGSLVETEPTSCDLAYPYGDDGGIHLGRLYFDEEVGTRQDEITTIVTAAQPDVLERAGIQPGTLHRTKQRSLQRRTWVRPYPDTTVAKLTADYERGVREGSVVPDENFEYLEHWITAEQLEKLKNNRNPFNRLSGFLKSR